jgi:hypothetical protein
MIPVSGPLPQVTAEAVQLCSLSALQQSGNVPVTKIGEKFHSLLLRYLKAPAFGITDLPKTMPGQNQILIYSPTSLRANGNNLGAHILKNHGLTYNLV